MTPEVHYYRIGDEWKQTPEKLTDDFLEIMRGRLGLHNARFTCFIDHERNGNNIFVEPRSFNCFSVCHIPLGITVVGATDNLRKNEGGELLFEIDGKDSSDGLVHFKVVTAERSLGVIPPQVDLKGFNKVWTSNDYPKNYYPEENQVCFVPMTVQSPPRPMIEQESVCIIPLKGNEVVVLTRFDYGTESVMKRFQSEFVDSKKVLDGLFL